MKSVKKLIFSVITALMLCAVGLGSVSALASDTQLSGQFKTVNEKVTLYASKSTSGDVIAEINAGESVLVINEDNQWAEVMHQGDTGFIYVNGKSVFDDFTDTAASQELEKRSQTDKSWIESYIAQMKAIRNARIWRIVIIVIIVVLVALIVFKSVKQNSKEAEAREGAKEEQ